MPTDSGGATAREVPIAHMQPVEALRAHGQLYAAVGADGGKAAAAEEIAQGQPGELWGLDRHRCRVVGEAEDAEHCLGGIAELVSAARVLAHEGEHRLVVGWQNRS